MLCYHLLEVVSHLQHARGLHLVSGASVKQCNVFPGARPQKHVCCVFPCRDKEIPKEAGKYIIQFSLRINKVDVLYSNQVGLNM